MRRTVCVFFLLVAGLAALGQERYPRQEIKFGVRVEPASWQALQQALKARPADPKNPVGVTLYLDSAWAAQPDWQALDAAVAAVREAGGRLCVDTRVATQPDAPETVAYLTAVSDHAGAASDALALSLDPSQLPSVLKLEPDKLALLLKQLTLALRGKSEATILLGEIAPEDLPLMDPLYERDFRAYVEGYSSEALAAGGEPSEDVVRYVESRHLGAPLLLHLPRVEKPIAAQLLVLASAAKGVTYTDIAAADVGSIWGALMDLRAHLTPRMGPGFATEATAIEGASGMRGDIGILNFLDADEMVQGMVLVPRVAGSKAEAVGVKMPTADITEPTAYQLPGGEKSSLGYTADQKKQEAVIKVAWQGKPLLVLFNRLKTGTVGEEKITVSASYRIPVEIILARYQAVQQAQDLHLENYQSSAEVDYHFKLPGGVGSLDVTYLNTFMFEKGVGARWVQNSLLINGVAWKGKKIPQLPSVEPEKVNTLPLALTLGRDYSYRYIKDEDVDGRDCFVVEFIPLPGVSGSLYAGKVWIDKKTYAKVKMSVKQTGLTEPQVSNDETDYFSDFQGPDGRTYRLLSRVSGQQLLSIGGVNFVAERAIRFSAPAINQATFSQEVAKAEAGDRPILQDTDKGLRYLEKQKDGTRKLQMEPDTHKLLGVGGVYYDQSRDYPIPLVGINYFDYDWRKTKTQINLFAAGAVNTLTVSKVDLLPKTDGAFNGVLFTVPFDDKNYVGGVEDESQRVKILREYGDFGLGWRFSELSKLKLDLEFEYFRYYKTYKTSYLFTLPKDHFDLDAALTYSFAWKGLSLSASYEGHTRTSWAPWGMPDTHSDANQKKNYALWSAAISKSFYLPYFQKISTGVSWLDGNDLDRFSRYEFTYLGKQSLAGFAGSGVRFDRGAIGTLGYEFNLAKVIRFGLSVDQAHVQPLRDVKLWQNHTGVRLDGSVTGPWQTYWTVDVGYAVASDIPPVRHSYTAAIVVLKLW